MEPLGPGVSAGTGYRAAVAVLAAALAATLLAGCSVTVQPKNVAAVGTPSEPPTSTASPTPGKPTPTTTPKPAAKDVDHPVCVAVRTAMLTAQQKVGGTDKADPRKMGNDFKAAGIALRGQALKTKNTDLRATLEQVGTDYENLGANVAAKRPTDTDLKKIAEIGPHLDQLCPQKP